MPRNFLLILAALVPLATVLPVLPVSAASAATGTTVSLTLTEPDGSTPMASAPVGIFYVQPSDYEQADGAAIHFTELGSGTTGADGSVAIALNTSVIAPSNLADIGNGTPDAFNAEIYSLDSSGNRVLTQEVLTLNAGFSVSLTATAGAAPHAPVTAATISGLNGVVVGHKYRYIPITPLNSGHGIQAVLAYTTDSSTSRQTQVTFAFNDGGAGWSLGGDVLEENSRHVVAPYTLSGTNHYWMWASYRFVETRVGCGHPTCVYQWNADYFSGNLSLWNPDCCIGRGSPIGNVQYPVPKFHPGPGNAYWFELSPHNSGWSRDSGTRRQSTAGGTFTFPFASTIGSNSVTTYGSVTSVTYNWIRSGACTSSDTRVIWGYKVDPVAAEIVQANCYPDSIL